MSLKSGPCLAGVRILDAGTALALAWGDRHEARFHAAWLRDNALDPRVRDPRNGQRLRTALDLPANTRLDEAAIADGDTLRLRFSPDGYETRFPGAWLRAHAYDLPRQRARGWCGPHVVRWGRELGDALPAATLDALRADRRALAQWLRAVRRHGFALLTGVPREAGAVCAVVDLFGHVRETNYGRCFDVRAEVDPVNLAYTALALAAHTDNPYRDPVPTLQLLACLESTAEGGASVVVDGFQAAAVLHEESPAHFDLLADHCARFEYAGSPGVRLRARRPILELAPDGELIAVRHNDRSAAPVVDVPYEAMTAWYEARRHFAEILTRPALRVRFRLAPGELFIVDNTRVLHAREAFSAGGRRWLQGCYADRDGLLSTLSALEEGA